MAGNHRWHKMEAATTISKGRLAARKEGNCADDICQGRTERSLQKQILRAGREHLEMPASQWWRSSAPTCPGKGSGFVCHRWYFQLAVHTSARLAIHSADEEQPKKPKFALEISVAVIFLLFNRQNSKCNKNKQLSSHVLHMEIQTCGFKSNPLWGKKVYYLFIVVTQMEKFEISQGFLISWKEKRAQRTWMSRWGTCHSSLSYRSGDTHLQLQKIHQQRQRRPCLINSNRFYGEKGLMGFTEQNQKILMTELEENCSWG